MVVLRCAPALLFQTKLLSQLDTVVTGEAVFCQIPMRQTNVLEYLKLFFRFAERMSRRPGAVVGNYKMYEEDPDEVKSLSYLNIFEQYMPYLNNVLYHYQRNVSALKVFTCTRTMTASASTTTSAS